MVYVQTNDTMILSCSIQFPIASFFCDIIAVSFFISFPEIFVHLVVMRSVIAAGQQAEGVEQQRRIFP